MPKSRKTFRMQQRFLELIKSGSKRWEGRLKTGAAAIVSAGCIVSFSSQTEELDMMVRSVREYKTFEDMLSDLGVETCLPGVRSLSQGVSIYHSFPGYAQQEVLRGV